MHKFGLQFGLKGLVYNYPFLRESYSVPHMNFFAIPSLILSLFEISRVESPKLTLNILMEIFIISFVVFNQFYFYMHQPIRLEFLNILSLS